MDEMQETPSSKERQPLERQRLPWHAPQFFVAGLASTFAQNNAAHDGNTAASSLS